MTQLIAELEPRQRTAIRVSTRERLLASFGEPGQPLVTRPLSPMDFGGQYIGGAPLRARLHTGAVEAGIWKAVAEAQVQQWAALAVWGYAAYRSDSQIDVLRLSMGGIYTLAELPLGELVAIERRDPARIRRRSGWLDPPVCAFGTRGELLRVSVLSDAGIPVDEAFTLLGVVAEPAGFRVMPDGFNR